MSESMAGRPSPCTVTETRKTRSVRARALVMLATLLAVSGLAAGAQQIGPPLAAERPHTVTAPFGSRSDPWYWLRDDSRTDPAMLGYLAAENAWRESVMAPLKPLENTLFE